MFRQGTYCLTRINRALKKPVQWEINMSQGQLVLCTLLPMERERERKSLSYTQFTLDDIYLISLCFYYLFSQNALMLAKICKQK